MEQISLMMESREARGEAVGALSRGAPRFCWNSGCSSRPHHPNPVHCCAENSFPRSWMPAGELQKWVLVASP